MPKTYTTSMIAKCIGIHPNTVRLYEKLGLIAPAHRKPNGYRIFNDLHVLQFQLARRAFQVEVLQNGLRKKAIGIVKTAANGDFDKALILTDAYEEAIQIEIDHAEEAVVCTKTLLCMTPLGSAISLKRKAVSQELGISMDTLRNWEMNGLLKIKRKENGYRVYTEDDLVKLKIIRTLKCANYSLSAILRLLNTLDGEGLVEEQNVLDLLNTPNPEEDIVSVCDQLLDSLNRAQINAKHMKNLILQMAHFSNPPL